MHCPGLGNLRLLTLQDLDLQQLEPVLNRVGSALSCIIHALCVRRWMPCGSRLRGGPSGHRLLHRDKKMAGSPDFTGVFLPPLLPIHFPALKRRHQDVPASGCYLHFATVIHPRLSPSLSTSLPRSLSLFSNIKHAASPSKNPQQWLPRNLQVFMNKQNQLLFHHSNTAKTYVMKAQSIRRAAGHIIPRGKHSTTTSWFTPSEQVWIPPH